MNANRRMDQPGEIEHSPRMERSLKPRHAAMSRFVALVFVAGVWGVFAPGPAQAQSSIPREETWVTNGPVYAIARTTDTVYIGGNFTHVGPFTGCGTPLDISTGQVQTPFPKVNGTVWACASDGLGGWFIGGEFTRVGDWERYGIAHIRSDRSVDPAWNPNSGATYPYVRALAVSGSTLYAAGHFPSIGGQPRGGIVAIHAATGNITAWNPNAGGVWAIAVSNSTVYIGGVFTSVNGQTRNYVAALDAVTGEATAWNPNASGGHHDPDFPWIVYTYVNALAVSGSTVYVGGVFTNIGGQPRNYIAALDATTGNATDWNPNTDGYQTQVSALAVSGSTIYVGGYFASIGGQPRNNIAALDAATGNATAWDPNAGSYVHSIVLSSSTVYVGGGFWSIGGQSRHKIAALDATTGNATAWDPYAEDTVFALAVSGSAVYIGGEFTTVGGQSRSAIAALDAATGAATAWNPHATAPSGAHIRALAVSGSTVYVGGGFSSIGGQSRHGIAALDATTGNATDWIPNPDSGVGALAVSGSTVYVGGGFTAIGGQPRNYIAALDTATGNATDWNPNANGWVLALAVSGSTVYAGGEFDSIGGQFRNSIAALDTATGNATAWDPNAKASGGAYPDVYALAVSGSTVYAGGLFTSIGGQSRHYIAALDAATGNATDWNPNASDADFPYVYALAVSGSTVYAGGGFGSIGGQPRSFIAALDAVTGNATAWNPNASDISSLINVRALAVSGSTVYAGGEFTTIGGEPRPYFAQFDTPPAAAARMWPLY